MQVQPYLFFDGRCDEALEFYQKAVGAKVGTVMRFKDAPDQSMISPGSHDKVMHAAVRVGDTQVLVSDGRRLGKPTFQGFALTITAPDAAEGERRFNALADGARCKCRLRKPSSRPASAWSPTSSASAG